jgi:hypothetical protein
VECESALVERPLDQVVVPGEDLFLRGDRHSSLPSTRSSMYRESSAGSGSCLGPPSRSASPPDTAGARETG